MKLGWHVVDPLAWALSGISKVNAGLDTRSFLLQTTISQVLFELSFLESIEQRVFLKPIGEVVHHDDFVAHSAKLYGVSHAEFIPLLWFEAVVRVSAHMSHHKPQLFTWIGFLEFGIFYFGRMESPILVIFEHNCSCCVTILRFYVFEILPHPSEIFKLDCL